MTKVVTRCGEVIYEIAPANAIKWIPFEGNLEMTTWNWGEPRVYPPGLKFLADEKGNPVIEDTNNYVRNVLETSEELETPRFQNEGVLIDIIDDIAFYYLKEERKYLLVRKVS